MTRVAALDLGSNTSLLLIADMNAREIARVVHDDSIVTRLGQDVHRARCFHPEALARMRACFETYAREITKAQCAHVIAVATSAARDVSNGDELIRLGREFGIPIHIISGAREAELTFHGALDDQTSVTGAAVIDVGGGSTEVIRAVDGQPRGTSVDVGSVRLSELFIHAHPVAAEELAQVRAYAREQFAKAPLPRGEIRELIAVAGTPTTLAAVDQAIPFSEERVHGYHLTLEGIERWTERLARMSVAERERLPGMQPKRADVIVAGGLILAEGLRALGQERLTVSTRGVRFGVARFWKDFV